MRKLLLGFIVIFSLSFQSFAQDSVGFSDPDNIQPLLDYRLPEWGYTNFYLDFSLDGNLTNRQSDAEQSSAGNHQYSSQIISNYRRYRESEERISEYSLSPFIDYSIFDQNSFNNKESNNSDFQLTLLWNFDERFYRDDSDFFFTGSFYGVFRQSNIKDEEHFQETINIDETSLNRSFNPYLSIGIGYGRLRNVNPMIRSLRMNERLNALNTGQTMDQNDIIGAAEHFTRLNGYRSVYDRHQKHFWGDMDNLLSADLAALDAFDLLYLTDVTQETIGTRQEGWEVSTTATLHHSLSYRRDEDRLTDNSNSRITKSTYLAPSVSGSWYKNLSLKHQIGLNGSFQYEIALDDESLFNGDYKILFTSINWLYTITDRILTNTTIAYQRTGRELYNSNRITIHTEANYFLEDRFSIFSNLRFTYHPNWSVAYTGETITNRIDQQNLIFDVGLRYYFKRNLF